MKRINRQEIGGIGLLKILSGGPCVSCDPMNRVRINHAEMNNLLPLTLSNPYDVEGGLRR